MEALPTEILIPVGVEKRYYLLRNPEQTVTLFGQFPLLARNKADARLKVEALMRWDAEGGTLQTNDPRIDWFDLPPGDGWELEDFSFVLTEEGTGD